MDHYQSLSQKRKYLNQCINSFIFFLSTFCLFVVHVNLSQSSPPITATNINVQGLDYRDRLVYYTDLSAQGVLNTSNAICKIFVNPNVSFVEIASVYQRGPCLTDGVDMFHSAFDSDVLFLSAMIFAIFSIVLHLVVVPLLLFCFKLGNGINLLVSTMLFLLNVYESSIAIYFLSHELLSASFFVTVASLMLIIYAINFMLFFTQSLFASSSLNSFDLIDNDQTIINY